MTERRCDTCVWWTAFNKSALKGLCRGAPPTPRPRQGDKQAVKWPTTTAMDWCGMHTPRKEDDECE